MTMDTPESATAAQMGLLNVLIAGTLGTPGACVDEGSLTVHVNYLPAADPSRAVDPRDRYSLERFEERLHALGINVAVQQSEDDDPSIEITIQTPADASALAQYIVDALPPHAAAAGRLRRALADAGISSYVTVARPLRPSHRCEHCRRYEGDSPAWCPRCLPREVAPGRLSPKNAALLLHLLPEAAPDWLAEADLDDMADLKRLAAALQSALRKITGQEVPVLAGPRCGVCDTPKDIEFEGTLSAAAANLITAALPPSSATRRPTPVPRQHVPSPPTVEPAAPLVDMPLRTRHLQYREVTATELERILCTAHSVTPTATPSSLPHDAAVITLHVYRLPLLDLTVTPSLPEVRALKDILTREKIDADVTVCPDEDGQEQLHIAPHTVADAIYLRDYIADNLPEDSAAAWRLYIALEHTGIYSCVTAGPDGTLEIEPLDPEEALRLHEVAAGRTDTAARALDLTVRTDVEILAKYLMVTLSILLGKPVMVTVISRFGSAGCPGIYIKTRIDPHQADHLTTTITRTLAALPSDPKGSWL